jgi:hypothetical protein
MSAGCGRWLVERVVQDGVLDVLSSCALAEDVKDLALCSAMICYAGPVWSMYGKVDLWVDPSV